MNDKIKEVMQAVFDLQGKEIPDDVAPDTVPEWDSFRHIKLIEMLEKRFEVRFSPHEIGVMLDLDAIRSVLQEKGVGN